MHIEASAAGRDAAMMRIPIPRGHTLEAMRGLLAAPKYIEADQSDERYQTEHTLMHEPAKAIAWACEVRYHWDTPELLCRCVSARAPLRSGSEGVEHCHVMGGRIALSTSARDITSHES
jgi:hypothetical protein